MPDRAHAKKRKKQRCIYCGKKVPVTRNRVCFAHSDLPGLEAEPLIADLMRPIRAMVRR